MSDTQIPLLSVKKAIGDHWVIDGMDLVGYNWYAAEKHDERHAHHLADFINKCINATIQAKIASGELRVAKTVRLMQKHPGGPPISNTEVPMNCPNCGAFDVPSKTQWWKFCPGCGSMIIE